MDRRLMATEQTNFESVVNSSFEMFLFFSSAVTPPQNCDAINALSVGPKVELPSLSSKIALVPYCSTDK